MSRRKVALGVLALVALAGCAGTGLGGAPAPSDEQLAQNATYNWNSDADVTLNVTGQQYKTVATVNGTERVRLASTSGFAGRNPVQISAVQFRYENGTVVAADAIDVSTRNQRTVVDLPAANGTFAYTGTAGARSVNAPLDFEGSHEVVLPAGMRASFPIFGDISPGGYETSVEDNRVHVRWSSLSNATVSAEYYLVRDLYIFAGLIGVLSLAAVGGVIYYRLRIRRLEREREEAGLDYEQ
ncbi:MULTISPECIES: DUF5803 family protein [Halobacterium]|uniref:DUF5803 family protein n=1 Tax=Halobacterium TaxID=2239 RepID=UPI000B222639|nr:MULTISPECIES: DUF5803 family protein [Halobacterium]MCG1002647.1 DUF5803 family protein [Halobacterium noricense]